MSVVMTEIRLFSGGVDCIQQSISMLCMDLYLPCTLIVASNTGKITLLLKMIQQVQHNHEFSSRSIIIYGGRVCVMIIEQPCLIARALGGHP